MERIRKERRTNRGFYNLFWILNEVDSVTKKVSDEEKGAEVTSNKLLVSPTPLHDNSCQSMLSPYVCP